MRWQGFVSVAAAVCLAACVGTARIAPPLDIPPPEVDDALWLPEMEDAWDLLPEPGPVVYDEILRSPLIRDPVFRREIERWVSFWQTGGARWFPDYLDRMGWFSPTVDSVFAEKGLPPSLRYLPIVESGYSPKAVSRASAVGLWQFMAPTAQGYGMWVGPLLDERRDPFKSTDAAGDFLLSLRERFGSWFLALAAYNSGPNRVQRLLDKYAPLAPRSDSLFLKIRPYLPRETRDYIPKFIAAAAVARNPTAHGIQASSDTLRFVFDEVVVPDATTLDVVAEAAATPQAEIERLNPEIVRGITPPGRRTTLRVPVGRGGAFEENYAKIPPGDRVTFVEHRVVRGETLSHIARRYGVPLRELQAANPRVNSRRLQIGQRLTVPVSPRARTGS